MKINWRVLIAIVVIAGVTVWAIESLRSRSYSGTSLNLGVGGGPVTVVNPSDESVPAQLVGAGSRSFTVTSTADGVSGSSAREGTGRAAVQAFYFAAAPGTTEFTVARGTGVNFLADADSGLDVTVQPLSASDARTTMIMAVVVGLAALFYISRTTGHRWLRSGRSMRAEEDAKVLAAAATVPSQGRAFRSYGDNRAHIPD